MLPGSPHTEPAPKLLMSLQFQVLCLKTVKLQVRSEGWAAQTPTQREAEQKAGARFPIHLLSLSFSHAPATAPTMSAIFIFFLNFFKISALKLVWREDFQQEKNIGLDL